jgi:hypothetical protein
MVQPLATLITGSDWYNVMRCLYPARVPTWLVLYGTDGKELKARGYQRRRITPEGREPLIIGPMEEKVTVEALGVVDEHGKLMIPKLMLNQPVVVGQGQMVYGASSIS